MDKQFRKGNGDKISMNKSYLSRMSFTGNVLASQQSAIGLVISMFLIVSCVIIEWD